jgi:DHA3 family macrolide efflux protein-like MFS transporter
MIFSDLMIALITFVLIILFKTDQIKIGYIYIALSCVSWKRFPLAIHALFHFIARSERSDGKSGRDESIHAGAYQCGRSTLAALLLDASPIHNILLIDIVTAIIAVAPLLFVSIPKPVTDAGQKITSARELWNDVKVGFNYLWNWKACFC